MNEGAAGSRFSRPVALLTLLALLSGCCALAYEVLYIRALTTLLGDMMYVHAALLSTFLIGIGLGARFAHRFPRWLWLLEILTGIYAIALPFFASWFAGQPLLAPITARPLPTILATTAMVCIPSLLIGFSIPLFSAYIKARSANRLAFQGVYIAYNLGALGSILLVEFVLVRVAGISLSLAVIGAINIFNGLLLLLLGGAPDSLPVERRRRFDRRIVAAVALASFASAMFQMFFLKLTYLVFGPHRENFSIALSITLLGICIGAWIASRTRIRFSSFLLGVPLLLGLIYLLHIPILRLHEAMLPLTWNSESALVAQKFIIGGLYALGPMILFGATLPALMRKESEVASESGYLLYVSSLANAAGYLIYVLVGHPLLSSGTLLVLLAIAALGAGWIAAEPRWSRLQRAAAACGLLLVAALFFQWQDRHLYLAQWFGYIAPEDEVLTFKSGSESATLFRSPGYEWLSYNGFPSITIQQRGVLTPPELVSGIIPAISAPRLEKALVLGLGTGMTSGAASRLFQSIDIVEINPAFLDLLPELAHANLDVASNPAANIHIADGRAFLVGRQNSYDVIVNSIPAPTYYSASKIYTLEFYERVVAALKPDGVFCTWLSPRELSEQGLRTVISALRRNFLYCDLRLLTSSYYMASCSNEKLRTRSFSELPQDAELAAKLLEGLGDVDLAQYFDDIHLSDNIFEHYEPHVPVENTDDHPVLEFMVVRHAHRGRKGEDPFVREQTVFNIDPVRHSELQTPQELARRAQTFLQLRSPFYEVNFEPLLRSEPDAQDN